MSAFLSGIQAVFFDAVGTLIHPDPPALVRYREIAMRHGIEISAEEVRSRFLAAFIREERIDREQNWETSEAREVTRWRHIVEATLPELASREDCFDELYDHFAKPSAWALDSIASEVFVGLRDRGLRIGMGSNYDRRLEAVVDGHPALQSLRPNIVISSVIGTRKPSAAFFTTMISQLDLRPEAVLFVGDDLDNDYEGARAAGLQAVILDPQGRFPTCRRIASLQELLP